MDIYEIIALTIIAVLTILYSSFKKGLMDMISKCIMSWFKEPFEGEKIDKEFNEIYERLTEIKTILGADRVYISQFHNGNFFSTSKPIWKYTRTYEICANGVSYESLNCQNILAITVWDSISAIFDTRLKKYCEKLKGGACFDGCKNSYGVYKYSIDKMPESFSKVVLRNQGIETYLQIPLVQNDNNIIGFVGIDFLDKNEKEINNCVVCQKVQEISYFLNKG